MKTILTAQQIADFHKSTERTKISMGDRSTGRVYVSKQEPTPAYQNMPSHKEKVSALQASIERGAKSC